MNQIKKMYARNMSDRMFHIFNVCIMSVLFIIFAWPLWFVVIASVSDPGAVWNGQVFLFPVGFNLDGYKEVLNYTDVWVGYRNTIFYTIAGTTINIIMTICAAYPLSRKDFPPRNALMLLFMFTMYFNGGLIPTYLVVKNLHMVNTPWALMIPNAISIFNVIIARTYFVNSIPDTLQEAAELDGANTLQYLVKIVLPLSKPIIAVISLYYGIGHWNSFFNALIYIKDKNLMPLQMFLRDILISNQNLSSDMLEGLEATYRLQLAETMKYGLIVIATVPVLCIYPFVQKFFIKGVMIGAVKG